VGDKIILFLDARPERAAILYQRMNSEDQSRTFWTSTVDGAICVLRDYKDRVDLFYLEYAMEGDDFIHPSREDCGLEVVRWLEKQDPTEYICKIIVTTWNMKMGKKMATRLLVAGYTVEYIPFGMGAKDRSWQ
jgi:hypothetical protein